MEFVSSLKIGMTPTPERDFFELNWFYERYIKYSKDVESQNSGQM